MTKPTCIFSWICMIYFFSVCILCLNTLAADRPNKLKKTNLLASLFGQQEDLCAPNSLGYIILLGSELFIDGLEEHANMRY